MKTLWNNMPCNHKVQKVEEAGWTDYIHNYDFGVMDFDEASHRFSGFSFDTQDVIRKIKEGIWTGSGFTGGAHDQLHFMAIREGDKVHMSMKKIDTVYEKIESKMI